MAWVVTPSAPTGTIPPGWTTTPTVTVPPAQTGWLGSGVAEIISRASGTGQLSTTALLARPFVAPPQTGNGTLSAVLIQREMRPVGLTGGSALAVPYSQILPSTPQFTGTGFTFGDTVSTHLEPQFTGGGTLSANTDGLTAVVSPGMSITGRVTYSITIDHTKVAGDLTDFPVYVDLNQMPESFWDLAGDGFGIRCYIGGTELACEIFPDYNELHAKVPALSSSTDTVITIVPNDGPSSLATQDVWSNDYVSVYHMGPDPSASIIDSAGGYDAVPTTAGAEASYGVMGYGLNLDGATTMSASAAPVITGANPRTMSAWIYTEASGNLTIWGQGQADIGQLWEMVRYNENLIFHGYGGGYDTVSVSAPLPASTVAYCCLTYDGTTMKVYLDGNFMGGVDMALDTNPVFNNVGGPGYFGQWSGIVDEARLSSVERSPEWIATEYLNVIDTAGFYSVTSVGESLFGSEGTLSGSYDEIHTVNITFAGDGALTGPLVPKLAGNLTGTGALSATDFARYARAAGLLASGALSSTQFEKYLRSVGLTGAGVLASLFQVGYPVQSGGDGTVSATVSQVYSPFPALNGAGALTAQAGLPVLPPLTGDGVIGAALDAGHHYTDTFDRLLQLRAGNLAGTGTLSGLVYKKEFRAAALSGDGSLTATMVSPLKFMVSAIGAGTTVAMPAHQAGDLIFGMGFRDGSASSSTGLPAGWQSLDGTYGDFWAIRFGVKIAQSSSETTGTWTNSTVVAVSVYRSGQGCVGGFGSHGENVNNSSSSILWPGFYVESPGSWAIRAVGHRTATNLTANIPAGFVSRAASGDGLMLDSNGPLAADALVASGTQSVNSSGGWGAYSAEVLDGPGDPMSFTENWNTGIDSSRWATLVDSFGGGSAVSVNSGVLQITGAPSGYPFTTVPYAKVATRGRMALMDHSASAQLVGLPSDSGGTAALGFGAFSSSLALGDAYLGSGLTSMLNGLGVMLNSGGATTAFKGINGTTTTLATNTFSVNVAFRFRGSGGTYYIDYSGDGGVNWTPWTSTTFAVPVVGRFVLESSVYFSGAATSIAKFDNVVIT